MKKVIISSLVLITVISSCKKDDAKTNTTAIDGTYNFKSMTAKTSSTTVGSDGEKLVSGMDYTSTNNQGTVTFKNGTLNSSGFQYSINATIKYDVYEDNVLVDSDSAPVSMDVPASSSSTTYKLVGADSIYFTGSGFGTIGTAQATLNPGGGHYTLSGNTLTLNLTASKDSAFSSLGVSYQMKQGVVTSVVLEKK